MQDYGKKKAKVDVNIDVDVNKKVDVYDSTYVKKNTNIYEDTYVDKNTKIYDDTYVDKNTYVRDDTYVDKNTKIYDDTYVDKNTYVRDNTYVDKKTDITDHTYIDKKTVVDVEDKTYVDKFTSIKEHTYVDVKKVVDLEFKVDGKGGSIIEHSEIAKLHDEDVNDVDNQGLINVKSYGELKMDDFSVDKLAIGRSFNGRGNDGQYSVSQANNLVDNDSLISPQVLFEGIATAPFQAVSVEGGTAHSDDGIDGNSNANDNDENGTVAGSAAAAADGIANVDAFAQDIVMGQNQQANFATLNVIGGDKVDADNIGKNDYKPYNANSNDDAEYGNGGGHGGGHGGHGGVYVSGSSLLEEFDDDVNDLDSQALINVEGSLTMDDFALEVVAIGDSFNGPGNDMQFDVDQANDMVDNDYLYNPQVKFHGLAFGEYKDPAPFQDVWAKGGYSSSGDGIYGNSTANNNGGSGLISGSTSASADAIANVEAFTQNIVMGANLQLNNFSATVVGGDSTVADDIAS